MNVYDEKQNYYRNYVCIYIYLIYYWYSLIGIFLSHCFVVPGSIAPLEPRISVPGRAGAAPGPIGGGGAPTKQYINRWANARLTGKAGPGGVVYCHIIAVENEFPRTPEKLRKGLLLRPV
jgi:hypothetical protein